MLAEMKKENGYLAQLTCDATQALLESGGAGLHNCLYRGKNLGNTFTAAQSAVIRAGTFSGKVGEVQADVYVGDAWSFNNVSYKYKDENEVEQTGSYSGTMRVADCDYYLRAGDQDLTTHHIVVVPDTNMFTAPMNATEGGYVNSKMRMVYLKRAEAIFKACFGEAHVLKHREFLVNAVKDGISSGMAWYDSIVELMDERMVYGSTQFDSATPDGSVEPWAAGKFMMYSVSCKKLNLFRHRPDLISNRQWYWLRNVVSAAIFANVIPPGPCCLRSASAGGGVFALLPLSTKSVNLLVLVPSRLLLTQ